MIKKKLTAFIAVILAMVLVFPAATVFADGATEADEATEEVIETETVTETESVEAVTETETEPEPESETGSETVPESETETKTETEAQEETTALLPDPEVLFTLFSELDPEIIEVLMEHPKLLAMLIPTLHVTVREGSVTISVNQQEEEDPEAGESYSFDIDGATILSFLQLFIGEETEPVSELGSALHGLTPDGNLTLVDDYGARNGEGQQFITLVTKSGNYFYLVIDRDDKGDETVHFMNLVDERDLFALMDEEEAADYQAQLASEHASKEAAEQAAAAAATQTEVNETSAPTNEPETEEKSINMLPVVIIILVIAAVVGVWFFKQTKKKKAARGTDPDADYSDDEEDYGAGQTEQEYYSDPYEDEILSDGNEQETGDDQ